MDGTTTNQVWDVAEGLPTIIQDGSTKEITGPGGLPIEQVGGDGSVLYYLQDQLGSTRGLTDSSGSIVATFTYDAYGNLTSSTGTATTPFQYAGQYTDSESGLQYLRARYYDPQTAQFLTVDPLVGLTQQPYGYAANNPISFGDPSGLSCQMGPFPSPFGSGKCSDDIGAAADNFVGAVLSLAATPSYAPSLSHGCNIGTIPGLGSIFISKKIRDQQATRGWSDEYIREVIEHPAMTRPATDYKTGEPATKYYGSDGYYVIRNDVTGNIVQIANRNDKGWIDDSTDEPVAPIQNPSGEDPENPIDPLGPEDPEFPIDLMP